MLLPMTSILPSSLEVALLSRGVSLDDAKAAVAEVERKLAEANEEVSRFPERVREVAKINPAAALGGSPTGRVPFKGLRTEVLLFKSTRYIPVEDHDPRLGGWISRSEIGEEEMQYYLKAPHYEVLVHLLH